ncbi:MAG: NAD(P)-dependent oxidoreductase [Patescibacteria group bacterium]
MSEKRALVTGCYGFVGPHMVELLVEQGYKVIATDHPNVRPKRLPPGVEFVPADLTDYDAVCGLISKYQPELEFLVASIFRYDIPREVMLRVNPLIMENCLKATRNFNPGVRHVVSWISSSVYGYSFRTPFALSESTSMLPRNAYEESKFAQHLICRQYYDTLPLTEIFPMAIYGPGGNYGAMVVIDMMAKNQMPGFPGGGKCRISLAHVKDVCRAALFLSERDDTCGRWYNLGDESSYTMREMMKYLQKEFANFGVRVDLLPISYPLWLMKAFAWRSEQLAKKHNHPPIVQRDFLGYFEEGFNFLVDTYAIRSLGFGFLYNDPIVDGGLRETLQWQREQGLI